MIRVSIHLISQAGLTTRSVELGVLDIYNDGTGTSKKGNYGARLYRKGTRRVHKMAQVHDWPRERLVIWRLLQQVLNNMYPEGLPKAEGRARKDDK